MGTVTVAIYERVKSNGNWTRVHVIPPQGRKRDGKLFLKDDRQGKFQLSWYENRQKQWQHVKSRVSDRELPYLSDAVAQAEDKSWYLSNRHRRVADPTSADSGRKKLGTEVRRYLEAKSGCDKTVSAHRHALEEFQDWATDRKKGRDIDFVDEIDKRLLRRFFEFLVDGDEEEDGPANCPFTAALKIMKVNSFYRSVYEIEPGKGPVTKKEYKRELNSSKVPEIYTKQELDTMFAAMDEDEHLVFSTLYEGAFRKRELMHLEDSDLTRSRAGRISNRLSFIQPKHSSMRLRFLWLAA